MWLAALPKRLGVQLARSAWRDMLRGFWYTCSCLNVPCSTHSRHRSCVWPLSIWAHGKVGVAPQCALRLVAHQWPAEEARAHDHDIIVRACRPPGRWAGGRRVDGRRTGPGSVGRARHHHAGGESWGHTFRPAVGLFGIVWDCGADGSYESQLSARPTHASEIDLGNCASGVAPNCLRPMGMFSLARSSGACSERLFSGWDLAECVGLMASVIPCSVAGGLQEVAGPPSPSEVPISAAALTPQLSPADRFHI